MTLYISKNKNNVLSLREQNTETEFEKKTDKLTL